MNKVLLLGTVENEPEIRYVDKGVCVAQLTLRTTDRMLIKNEGGENQEVIEFHRVVLWRELGELVEKYVHANDVINVEGKLHYRSYSDHSGLTHHLVEVWASSFEKI